MQKPLTHKLEEARHLAKFAKEKGLTTQMGIRIPVQRPIVWLAITCRKAFWEDQQSLRLVLQDLGIRWAPFKEKSAIPDTLNWNLWLGTAPVHDYVSKVYHPGQWRKLLDFGCGTLGDMGMPHIFDTPFKALDLKDPKWVEADCRAPNGFGHAEKNMVRYGFKPTKYTTDDFTFTWWDGTDAPRHKNNPDLMLPNGDELPKQAVFVEENGRMVLPHCSMPTFYPRALSRSSQKPDGGGPLYPISGCHRREGSDPCEFRLFRAFGGINFASV